MKKMMLTVLFLMTSLVASAQQPGSTPATRDDVLRFFSALRVQKQTEDVQAAILQNMRQLLDQMLAEQLKNLTDAERLKFQKFLAETLEESQKSYPVAEMLEDMIPVYQKNFTKQEIDAVVAFYTSPVGKSLLDRQPTVTQEAMAAIMPKMQQRMRSEMQKMQTRLDAVIQEMLKEKEQAAPPKSK